MSFNEYTYNRHRRYRVNHCVHLDLVLVNDHYGDFRFDSGQRAPLFRFVIPNESDSVQCSTVFIAGLLQRAEKGYMKTNQNQN